MDTYLSDLGLDADAPTQLGRVAFSAFAGLWSVAEAHRPSSTLGLEVAQSIPFGARDLADFALRSAPTFGDMAHLALEIAPHMDASLIPMIEPVGTSLIIRAGRAPGDPVPDALSAYGMARLLMSLRHVAEERLQPEAVFLTRGAPADDASYRAYFGCPVHFGHAFGGLQVPRDWMQRELPGADPALHATLLKHMRQLFGDSTVQVCPVESVLRVLSELLAGGRPVTQERVAKRLGCSPRSLRRVLEEHGTSYAELYDQARLEHAQAALRAGQPIKVVSERVGFASPASFNRTFRRWVGQPPAEWQRSQA
ncbi:MAG: AraC family transcriptional regulator [bacterium]|nr:AraC family transcriptional regulator [bacterium]